MRTRAQKGAGEIQSCKNHNGISFKEAKNIWEHRLVFGIRRGILTVEHVRRQGEGRFANEASDDTFCLLLNCYYFRTSQTQALLSSLSRNSLKQHFFGLRLTNGLYIDVIQLIFTFEKMSAFHIKQQA